ncbi:glycosyltransferase family 1 protein [Enterococcus faecium]|uniref:glycosyltransferase family 1 protein n=1 Tax=Enterococcus faecium TaxID=1352 RepID=UPI00202D0A10|nr:glycosyltransferase family 1 protein [Enterococcus faecium]MCL9978143.1 glycosyltransferase family 1 protein [Enterococcus faecium]MDQ8304528.1 glycosyltransferase family 1 protein [Enterococcus faecium]MDQ8428524.1 glycosyltransferase family 1 protein [Enterococcus faecium]
MDVEMKRMLCIVSSLDIGGAETFMMKIFRSLPKNYKIDFIVSTNTGYYEDEVLQLGGKIFRIPLRTKHPIKSFWAIKKIVKSNKYEVVLKMCDTPKGYFDLLAAKLGGAEKLCVRSCNSSSSGNMLINFCNSILRPAFNKIADVKIAPSDLAAIYTFGERAVKSGEVYFLHNAVDLDVFKYSEDERNKIRNEFNIMDCVVIGHIGRFNIQKNHKYLISIFEEIKRKITNVKLLLVGNGELEEEILDLIKEKKIQEDVIFTGIRSDVPSILSAMDVFVFPSLFEGMPNTVIEAQATGLPCVISDTITREVAITDLITYESIYNIPEKWSNEVERSLKIGRKDMRKDFISAKYDIKKIVEEFIHIIFY